MFYQIFSAQQLKADLQQKVERIAGLLEEIKSSRHLAEMIERDCSSLSSLLASRDREIR